MTTTKENNIDKKKDLGELEDSNTVDTSSNLHQPNINDEGNKGKLLHKISILANCWTYGWVVAILTIFITIFAYTQWNTLKTNMIIGERAWVIVKKAEHGPVNPLNDRIAAKLIFTNSGNTPALNFKISCVSDIRENPPKTVYDSIIPDDSDILIPIGPNETHSQIVECKRAIDKGIWAGIHSGTVHFYVWGVIEYIDVFNEKRKTEFCFVSSKNTGVMRPCKDVNRIY